MVVYGGLQLLLMVKQWWLGAIALHLESFATIIQREETLVVVCAGKG